MTRVGERVIWLVVRFLVLPLAFFLIVVALNWWSNLER
jgi:hypothetical protein